MTGENRHFGHGLIRALSRRPSQKRREETSAWDLLSVHQLCYCFCVIVPAYEVCGFSVADLPLFVNQRRVFLGRIISLQSKSPRRNPKISISAEARLVATGTLWMSHWWMVCKMHCSSQGRWRWGR